MSHQLSPVTVESTPQEGVRWHEAAETLPWIEGAAFDELKADIAENGVLEPIVFLGAEVLDGRNRYMAARNLGLPYPRVEYLGDDPVGFVLSKNLHRRHLTEGQLAMSAAKLAKLPRGGDRTSEQRLPGAFEPTLGQAAESLGVSRASVVRAKAVLNTGAPEVIAAVESGELGVKPAAEIAKLPHDEQPAALAAVKETETTKWVPPIVRLLTATAKKLKELDVDAGAISCASEDRASVLGAVKTIEDVCARIRRAFVE